MPISPAQPSTHLKKLRILIRHAINIGWIQQDPSLGVKRPKIQRILSWTEDEIELFRKKWPLVIKQGLAFELFLNTGQRRSDVVRIAWCHITHENKIAVAQQKTGRRLLIPLHLDLLSAIAVAKRDNMSIITTACGKSFTVDGFSQWMRDAITDAGLPLDCQPHGLRKATGRRLAEAGATAKKMIMSVLVQVFGRRHDEPFHALWRPASKKRQGTKSREVEHRRCSGRYGDLMAALSSMVDVPLPECGRRITRARLAA
ncbi:tyrosine-type recombinase/integrase [Bradyrhizobium sp.]|uniref:tyrosine-type recombinase/integrase n=1 Tax=Bradyrhizobium sp. TaxID=376 RepID=UPI003C5CE350